MFKFNSSLLRPIRGREDTTTSLPRVALRRASARLRCTRGYHPAPCRGEELAASSVTHPGGRIDTRAEAPNRTHRFLIPARRDGSESS